MSSLVFRSEAAREAVHAQYRRVLDSWPAAKQELRLPTSQGETFVIVSGRAELPPLVLCHGSQANSAAWMFDIPVWSQQFRCYAIDMIGEPGLSAPSRPPLNSEAYAFWLDEIMEGLGLTKASFVGASLGGWLALDYARRRPQAVERIALLCPAGIGRQRNFLLKAAPLLLLGPWGARKVREMVFGPSQGEPPPAARPLVELMSLIAKAVRPRIEKIPRLTDSELARLPMPLLVIVGGRDVLLDSFDTRRRLSRWLPGAKVIFLPEARHFIPGQTQRILKFLCGEAA